MLGREVSGLCPRAPLGLVSKFQVGGRARGKSEKSEGLSLFIQEGLLSLETYATILWNRTMAMASCKGVWEVKILDSTTSVEEVGRGESVGNRGRISQQHITVAVAYFHCLMDDQEGRGRGRREPSVIPRGNSPLNVAQIKQQFSDGQSLT